VESVWDYPRPPRVEPCARPARVEFGGRVVAESSAALRVLETSQAPAIYLPTADVNMGLLEQIARTTYCEWKGQAGYFDLVAGGRRSQAAAWTYRHPAEGYEAIRDHVAFYPQRVDACLLGDERVGANGGDFYGGWITSDIRGPFKGAPGTAGW
jgi:uncharacterized protein (DUF427 family)